MRGVLFCLAQRNVMISSIGIHMLKVINSKLVEPLNLLFPSFKEFESKFVQLSYSSKINPNNLKTKYVINKLQCYYEKSDTYADRGTIEHVIPESCEENSTNIGNLILLESEINCKETDNKYVDKRESYRKSSYKWVIDFVDFHQAFEQEDILYRAEEMAKIYYKSILGKSL